MGACVGVGGGVGVGHAAGRLLGRHVARVAACRLRGAGLQGPGAGVPGAAARRGLHGTRAAQQRKPESPWWGRSPAVQVRQRRTPPGYLPSFCLLQAPSPVQPGSALALAQQAEVRGASTAGVPS